MAVLIEKQRSNLNLFPIPIETISYKPVSHIAYIEAILEETDKNKLMLIKETYNIARKGNIIKGELVFKGSDNDINMMIGVVNSYDKSKPAMIGVGGSVIICENGLLIAEYSLKRKHTTHVWKDLTALIHLGVNNLNIEYEHTLQIRDRFSGIPLSKTNQAELLGKLFVEEKVITPTMANIVRQEILGSKLFPEESVWAFYNHITHALKESHPNEYIDKHIGLHKFMLEQFC